MAEFKVLRGMRDYLPEDLEKRKFVVDVLRWLFYLYGYSEVGTPTLEAFDLVSAKVGDEIRHRMYSFTDLGGRKVAMRPEMTAPIARLVATKLKNRPKPLRLSYIANCFRYDNPQAGRYREFWQAGFELFGSPYSEADAEILIISRDLMERLGFKNYYFKIGHVGILRGVLDDERVRVKDQNMIMGAIDKGELDRALSLLSKLEVSEKCFKVIKKLFQLRGTDVKKVLGDGRVLLREYSSSIRALENLEEILELFLRSARAKVDVSLGSARGLEYYTGMIFEVYIPEFRIALNGGGRYDGLVKLFGGSDVPAVGCAPGIDRIILALDNLGLFQKRATESRALVVATSKELQAKALEIVTLMRGEGLPTEWEVSRRSVSKALSYAISKGFTFFILVAPHELRENRVVVKYLKEKEQKIVPINDLTKTIRSYEASSG